MPTTTRRFAPRELKLPALLELDGISRETVEAHYKLYQALREQAQRGLLESGTTPSILVSFNQVYSDLRSLRLT